MRILTIVVFCCWTTPVWSQLLLYDGFSPSPETDPPAALNYRPGEFLAAYSGPAPGEPLVSQHNVEFNLDWRSATGNGTAINAPGITDGSLSLTGLPASAGNSVLFDHTQLSTARIGFAGGPVATGTIYWSGLFRVNTLGNLRSTVMLPGATNGVILGSFNQTQGYATSLPTVLGSILLVRPDFEVTPLEPKANSYQIGLGASANNNDKLFADTAPQNVGDTVLIVASYEIVDGTTNDISHMWINPDPSSYGAAEDSLPATTISSTSLALKSGGDLVGGSCAAGTPCVASFHLRNNNAIWENTNWQFDELRVGTTWASVTSIVAPPELAGDFNGDGRVDAADYATWRDNLGGSVDLPGDDTPGVDENDYDTWVANFGAPVVGAAAGTAVPEPAAWLLCSLGALVVLCQTGIARRKFSAGRANWACS